jgi:hypothetical protein
MEVGTVGKWFRNRRGSCLSSSVDIEKAMGRWRTNEDENSRRGRIRDICGKLRRWR